MEDKGYSDATKITHSPFEGESKSISFQASESKANNMFYGASAIHFELAKKLRDSQTEAESFLWNNLGSLNIPNIRFKRQHPILYFIADFYCHKAKLVIEVDGGYHNIPEQYIYDRNRDSELEDLGLKVIHFTNEQILFQTEKTLEEIKTVIENRLTNVCY